MSTAKPKPPRKDRMIAYNKAKPLESRQNALRPPDHVLQAIHESFDEYRRLMALDEPRRLLVKEIARKKFEIFGIDRVCDALIQGVSLAKMAKEFESDHAQLCQWVEADKSRSAKVKEARRISARHWDEHAEWRLDAAKDMFELAKAKELAVHYRWRAKMVAPKDYADRVTQEVTGPEGGPLQMAGLSLNGLSDEDLETVQRILSKITPA